MVEVKRGRGRPRKNPIGVFKLEEKKRPVGRPPKKKMGRPVGSKNKKATTEERLESLEYCVSALLRVAVMLVAETKAKR